ncbi:MAG: NADPH-dependent glutamate synthase [Christensenellales bacterium]|jgi:glutamate synthase (NADPH/NADH) small chain
MKNRVAMREQDPKVRAHNFEEVTLGYNDEEAVTEALRCLQCKRPFCIEGCPVGVPIPQFIGKIAQGDFKGAIDEIKSTNSLPAVCGRVCPQESQCEAKCVLGRKGEPIAIGRLERFAADMQRMAGGIEPVVKGEPKGKKVAVVGAGPAGLTAAGDLLRMGYDVTVMEALHELGGVLVYGIPEFRLPKALVKAEIQALKDGGVVFEPNTIVGKTVTVDELMDEEGYDAVFLGSGAGLPSFLNIPGENLNGVYSANEYLTRINLMKAYKPGSLTPIKRKGKVAVIGGGNVAMDAARCALRLGAEEVHIIYRRSFDELPARVEEVHHAKAEGVIFDILTNPVEILGDGTKVTGMRLQKMQLGEPDDSGRRRPVPISGSEYDIELDTVIVAIGTSPNPLISMSTEGLETNRYGCFVVDEETLQTTREGVYAGGDAVSGAATVILAMGAGKKAAKAIDEYLSGK